MKAGLALDRPALVKDMDDPFWHIVEINGQRVALSEVSSKYVALLLRCLRRKCVCSLVHVICARKIVCNL